MAKTIFGLGIFAAVALIMIGIGAVQRRSRTPLGIMIWYHHRLCARYLRKKQNHICRNGQRTDKIE